MNNIDLHLEILKLAVRIIEKGYHVTQQEKDIKLELIPEHISHVYHKLVKDLKFQKFFG